MINTSAMILFSGMHYAVTQATLKTFAIFFDAGRTHPKAKGIAFGSDVVPTLQKMSLGNSPCLKLVFGAFMVCFRCALCD